MICDVTRADRGMHEKSPHDYSIYIGHWLCDICQGCPRLSSEADSSMLNLGYPTRCSDTIVLHNSAACLTYLPRHIARFVRDRMHTIKRSTTISTEGGLLLPVIGSPSASFQSVWNVRWSVFVCSSAAYHRLAELQPHHVLRRFQDDRLPPWLS